MAEYRNHLSFITMALGILTIISPYVNDANAFDKNLTITGGILFLTGLLATRRRLVERSANFLGPIAAFAGIWLCISIGPEETDPTMLWSNLVLGAMAFVTGLVSVAFEPKRFPRDGDSPPPGPAGLTEIR